MIEIITNVRSLERFIHNAKRNILHSQTALASKLTKAGYVKLKAKAPKWKETLSNKVSWKVFPKTHRGELFMADAQSDLIARDNEYNLYGKQIIPRDSDQLLDEWANDKGLFMNQRNIVVGGSGTWKGNRNKFFYPAFLDMNAMVPQITEQVIGQAILRTKG